MNETLVNIHTDASPWSKPFFVEYEAHGGEPMTRYSPPVDPSVCVTNAWFANCRTCMKGEEVDDRLFNWIQDSAEVEEQVWDDLRGE